MVHNGEKTTIIEVAWEVCNQVGGIYTVIRSKVPTMMEKWGDDYLLIGPYFDSKEIEPIEQSDDDAFKVVKSLRERGFEVHYGYWLVTGKPKVILINPFSAYYKLGEVKYDIWENHNISFGQHDDLLDQVVGFSYIVKEFLSEFARITEGKGAKVAHFHEWMAGLPIPMLRKDNVPMKLVFTTHATLLGRYLAMNDPEFYHRLNHVDWEREAKHFNIDAQARIERAAAHGANIFTTVSDVTAAECVHILGRQPEVILPNGLNIERYAALHEFQNQHKEFKDKINEFVMGHFFQSYPFDLDNTLYFFTSGRYEYKNKGYDLTLEALARLNHRMQVEGIDTTVVMFIVTRQPYQSITPHVLEKRIMMDELRQNCEQIIEDLGKKLFEAAASGDTDKLPDLNQFVDEYWRLRYRRTWQSWKSGGLPPVVTHNLWDDGKDDILNFLRTSNLVNNEYDKVKVVYHPDFINSTSPLFHIDYDQFVRGCHLGVFPSYYEPWGYTPLECIARGVPTITSDLAGFGDYVINTHPDILSKGVYVTQRRHKSFHESADELANQMYEFVKQDRRERIGQRNDVEATSVRFDWSVLVKEYEKAYLQALQW